MIIKVTNNRFIVPPLRRAFYQQFLATVTDLSGSAITLTQQAEHAYSFRDMEQVREIGQVLSNYALKEFHIIGQYYLGWYEVLKGGNPMLKLEHVVEHAPTPYRVRALHSLAAVEARKQNYESELFWLTESLKVAPSVEALRGVAIVKAKEGYHRDAVKDLERLLFLVRFSGPLVYYSCLNSYAVELGEIGRKEEARNISKVVLASPFAFAYPEWRETAEELKGPNRSFVVIDPSPARMGKLLSMPVVEHSEPAILDRPASVLSLQEWKDKMVKDKNGKNEKLPEDMNGKDMVVKIMNLTTQEGVSEKNLRKILDYVRKVLSEPDKD
jgi:hypothetical protein